MNQAEVAWSGPLGDALIALIDHRGKTPKKLGGDWTNEGVRVYSAVHVKEGRLDGDEARRVSWEMYERWMPEKLRQGDVLLTSEAPLGEVAYLKSNEPACLGQRLFALRPRPEILDSRYLYYWLQHSPGRSELLSRASGTTVSGIRQAELVRVPLDLPAVPVQRKIATVLAAYDELIENNLRRVQILEEMAHKVYREWFVNFRFPGHEDVALVGSPLGPIPEGWTTGTFGDLAENQRVNVNPVKFPDEQFDHFSFAAFDEGRVASTERGETMKSGKLLIDQDSVLLAKLNPRIPRVWFARPDGVRRSVASSEFLVLTPRTGSALELIYATCRDPSFQSRLATMSGGTSTSHQRLKLDDLMRLPIPVPSKDAVEVFVDVARPMYRLVTNLATQNENLRTTRDLLLPKLVSGEVDVSDMDIDTDWLAS